MRNEADGMLGAVMASESLGLTDTMINGAGGCRSRMQIMMHDLIPKYYPENMGCCRSKYFSRQSRLPCTYLNNDDYIFGSAQKISKGIESVSEVTGKRTVLLDTLGASLVCTDYSGLTGSSKTDPIFINGDLSSMKVCEGYDLVMNTILSSIDIDGGDGDGVNILGYGIMDLGWNTGADHISMLLEMMGVKVNCILGCLPDKESIKNIGNASLNIMIHPEFCRLTAEGLRQRFGTDSLRPSMGAPIGYDSLRSFVKEVAERLKVDPSPALGFIDAEAEQVHQILMNYDRLPFSMHAKGFTIHGDSSVAYPLMRWVMEAFGMAPRHIMLNDDEYLHEIDGYLKESGFAKALEGIDGPVEVVFSDGMDALQGRMNPSTTSHVEICLPRGRSLDLMNRTLIGCPGARYILDEMFNNNVRFRCGQPTDVIYRPGYEG